MTERLHPVRLVHQHLRRAATLLEQRQFDAATAEVDAALAVDPASLTARALQQKIAAARLVPQAVPIRQTPHVPAPAPATPISAEAPPAAASADESTAARTDAFIPPGVDPETWLGFEQRMQERRFRALLQTLAAALRAGDAVGARLALEEARELRPDAPELETAADQLVLVPLLNPVAASRSRARSRTLGAVSLLACGIALLTGLDTLRRNDAPPPADLSSPDAVTAPTPPRAVIAVPRMAEVPAPLLPTLPTDREVIGTVGVRPALAIEPPVQFTEPILRPVTLVERTLPPVGEIPDDYVAPASAPMRDVPPAPPLPARPTVTQTRETPAAALPSGSTASVNTPPVSTTPPVVTPAPPPAAAAPVAAPIVTPRADETGVSLALTQYARAYDRLDAGAARAVWPTVDERALARAFAGLESQQVSFDSCDIDVRGATANASCRGKASYVGKVGSREVRTEPRQWRFQLRRDGEAWKIETAEARRVSAY